MGNWRILKTGIYQIKAMCDGCVPAVSRPIRVVSGDPFSLRLLQQPSNSRSGAALGVTPVLEATDVFGNAISDMHGEVFVRLLPGDLHAATAREWIFVTAKCP